MKKNIDNQKIVSPCISICRTDPRTGYCYGCARTNEEKIIWKNIDTNSVWKKENLINLLRHMLRAGFKVNNLPKKYKYLDKEVLHD